MFSLRRDHSGRATREKQQGVVYPLVVIPAKAGIQRIEMKSCAVFLDSRPRGNDDGMSHRIGDKPK